jgi:hypothetical protein
VWLACGWLGRLQIGIRYSGSNTRLVWAKTCVNHADSLSHISVFLHLGKKNENIIEEIPQIREKIQVEMIQGCLRILMDSICRFAEPNSNWKVEKICILMVIVACGKVQRIDD